MWHPFKTAFAARLADNTIDAVVSMADLQAATDAFKWDVNGSANYLTVDGTHPSFNGHEKMAEALRPVIRGL